MDLRNTLNLPDADFTIPMKANLSSKEPEIQAQWDKQGMYHRLQDSRKDAPVFLLHDGPPYTNGSIHIGHALNKLLKDFVLKSKAMMGYRVPYVPGFDNHGLPIEQVVMKDFQAKKETPDITTFRQACRSHAQKYIDLQITQFQQLGIFGLWERTYSTLDYKFEAEIVRVFKRLAEKGFIYKGLRPTLWSPTSQTALADTEIVYQEHMSKSIYVRFPLKHDHNGFSKGLKNFYTIIWTTTPWTIPANLAVAFHPMKEYVVVQVGDDHYLLVAELLEKVASELGWTDYRVAFRELGISMEHSIFKHPIFDRDSIAVMAEYVTTEDGTGVVHTAPGHGRDDFYTGQKYDLPILCPVNEKGVMTEEAGEFAGLYYSKANDAVIQRLEETGNLLKVGDYPHSYPYAERDGQPVIFRATEQWFVNIDHHNLRKHMLHHIEETNWVPASGEKRISTMIGSRPDWCISRQRPWGVGIPVFYGKESREAVLDPVAIEAVAQLVEREGSDAWFTLPASEILPKGYKHPETGETEFDKETDVLDVWFDSGSTSLCVLEGNVDPSWEEKLPADLYLEGSDQHRGWFNSSLIISTALKDHAPYKEVVTHGFVTDDTGRKMSKRLGNVVDPLAVAQQYGVDILRYWVASVNYENDVPCSDALLKQFSEQYRSVRNTLRFLLSNLYDFDQHAKPEMVDLDEWIMGQVDILCAECVDAYNRYDFGAVINGIHNFCVTELSRFYLDAIKDRMYCDGKDWDTRRSAQIACHYVLIRLTKLVAPILAHTAEETWEKIPANTERDSIHLSTFEVPDQARLQEIGGNPRQARFASLLLHRSAIFTEFEKWKVDQQIRDSQDVIVSIRAEGKDLEFLKSFEIEELANYLKMSWVELEEGPKQISFRESNYLKCERSRLRRPDVETVDGVPLTARDRKVLEQCSPA